MTGAPARVGVVGAGLVGLAVARLLAQRGEDVTVLENVAGIAALHSPTTAIVDYRAVASAMAEDLRAAGGRIVFGAPVTAIAPAGAARSEVRAGAGRAAQRFVFDRLVICAGLHSDLVA